jgi:hypothetical protein
MSEMHSDLSELIDRGDNAALEAGADPSHGNRWGLGAADWAQWSANAAEVRALLHAAGR